MKIAIVVPEMAVGGMETYVLRMGKYLLANGHDVTVIASMKPGAWWSRVERSGLTSICLRRSESVTPISHIRKIAKHIREAAYQCVFINHCRYTQLALSDIGDSVIAIPILHNDHPLIFEVGLMNTDCWNLAIGVSERVSTRARAVCPDKEIKTIPTGADMPLSPPSKSADGFSCLYVGRLYDEQKNIHMLPEIVSRSRKRGLNVSLDVIGDGPDKNSFEKQVEICDASEHIRIMGYCDNESVYREMSSHHLLLLPSRFEGLGLVVAEAQINGCVPVVSNLPGATDTFVEHGRTGYLCDPGNVDDFVDAIETLYNDRALYDHMSKDCAETAKARFSVEAMGSSYQTLLTMVQNGECPQVHRKPGGSWQLMCWKDYVPNAFRAWKAALSTGGGYSNCW